MLNSTELALAKVLMSSPKKSHYSVSPAHLDLVTSNATHQIGY